MQRERPKSAHQLSQILSLKWEFYAGKDISATPAIYNGAIYFPSWNGYIYAVNAFDGSLIWKQYLQNLTAIPPTGTFANVTDTVSRSTPTVAEDKLIIAINGPSYVIAVKRATGQLLWSTKLDNNSLSIVTMSGTFFQGSVNFASQQIIYLMFVTVPLFTTSEAQFG